MNRSDYKINIFKVLVYFVFISIYMLPIKFLDDISSSIKGILFAFIILIYYLLLIKKISIHELVFCGIIVYFIIINKSITYLHLLSIPLIYKIIHDKDIKKNLETVIYNSKVLEISAIFVIIYSIKYFGIDGRYVYTGIAEPNQSGFSVLFLALLMLKKNKKIGYLIMFLGIFTMSRNYLVAVIIFFIFKFMKNNKIWLNIQEKINFKNLTIISIIALIILSFIFTNLYNEGKLSEYKTGLNRFSTFIDYSNYFRFTINTNVINLYIKYPEKLLEGISNEEFFDLNLSITNELNGAYRRIKPHNYFFAYLQLYGVFSIFIFTYINKIFKKIVVQSNKNILLILFFYVTFLGIGLASYWLYLSIFTIIIYGERTLIE